MLYLSRLLAGAGLGYTGKAGKAGELQSSILLHLHTRVGQGKGLIVGIIKSSLPVFVQQALHWSTILVEVVRNLHYI